MGMKLPPDVEQQVLTLARVHAPAIETTVSEREFQNAVVKEARRLQWKEFHPKLSVRSTAGWPDLALCRSINGVGRLILAELKTETGTLSSAQLTWGELLRTVQGVEYFVWRPSQWTAVLEVLQ